MQTSRRIFVLLLLLAAVPARADERVGFVVLRDGRPIGTHWVEIEQAGGETRVHISITLDVRFGFIPLYSYRHESREIWKDGRLMSLQSQTDDDGRTMTVSARASADGLHIVGPAGAFVAPPATVPTSYWNRALLDDRPLLDTQDGRLLGVRRLALGQGWWRLEGDLNLDVAYAADGSWSGLRFHHKDADFLYLSQKMAEHL